MWVCRRFPRETCDIPTSASARRAGCSPTDVRGARSVGFGAMRRAYVTLLALAALASSAYAAALCVSRIRGRYARFASHDEPSDALSESAALRYETRANWEPQAMF